MKSFHSLNMTKRRKKHIGVFIQSSVSRIPRLPDLPLLPVQLERLRAPRLSPSASHATNASNISTWWPSFELTMSVSASRV